MAVDLYKHNEETYHPAVDMLKTKGKIVHFIQPI